MPVRDSLLSYGIDATDGQNSSAVARLREGTALRYGAGHVTLVSL